MCEPLMKRTVQSPCCLIETCCFGCELKCAVTSLALLHTVGMIGTAVHYVCLGMGMYEKYQWTNNTTVEVVVSWGICGFTRLVAYWFSIA